MMLKVDSDSMMKMLPTRLVQYLATTNLGNGGVCEWGLGYGPDGPR